MKDARFLRLFLFLFYFRDFIEIETFLTLFLIVRIRDKCRCGGVLIFQPSLVRNLRLHASLHSSLEAKRKLIWFFIGYYFLKDYCPPHETIVLLINYWWTKILQRQFSPKITIFLLIANKMLNLIFISQIQLSVD